MENFRRYDILTNTCILEDVVMILLQPDDVMKYLFVPIVKTALENTKPFVNDYVLHLVRRTKPLVVHEMRFSLRLQWDVFR